MVKENLVELFANSIRNNWEQSAITDYLDKKTFSYGQIGTEIAKLHLLLKEVGIERGDKISIIGKNGSSWCIVYIATITYGAVVVPILQDFPPLNVHNIVTHSDSKLLFASDYIWNKLSASEMPNIVAAINLDVENQECFYEKGEIVGKTIEKLDGLFAEKYPNGYSKEDVKYTEVANSELVCISYTSGTPGFSKGVMLSANNFAGNIVYGLQTQLVKNANVVSFLPLAHAYCCAFDFLSTFCEGSHTYYLGKTPAAPLLLKALAEVKPDCIFTVPLIIEKVYKKQIQPLLKKPFVKILLAIPILKRLIYSKIRNQVTIAFGGNFREIIIGGAAFNPEVEAFFHKIGFHFTVGYGMTECAPLISHSKWYDFKITSVGKTLPLMDVRIDSEDPYNTPGEILVRGENVMMGYYKNEEATKEALDEEGWLHTGDVGIIDNEKYIYIRGRKKSMLLGPNGQNIYPEEIEDRLNNMPLIQESVVLQNKNNKLVALVSLDNDLIKKRKYTKARVKQILDKILLTLNKQSGAYEQVSELRIFEGEFEKTPKKSIKRYLYTNSVE